LEAFAPLVNKVKDSNKKTYYLAMKQLVKDSEEYFLNYNLCYPENKVNVEKVHNAYL